MEFQYRGTKGRKVGLEAYRRALGDQRLLFKCPAGCYISYTGAATRHLLLRLSGCDWPALRRVDLLKALKGLSYLSLALECDVIDHD